MSVRWQFIGVFSRRWSAVVRTAMALGSVAILVGAASTAWAVDTSSCTPTGTYNSWINNTLVAGAASAPASDTPYIPAGRPLNCNGGTGACGRVYFAKGTTLYSIEDRGSVGQLAWTWVLPTAAMGENSGSTLSNFPSATPGDALHPLVVYIGGDNGRLYKLDGQNTCNPGGAPACTTPVPLAVADLRRKDVNGALLCNTPPGDRLAATPAVLLNAFSPAGGAFQTYASAMGHPGADLVFAMTFNGCGDTTHNAVYALWSDNIGGAPQWVYQGTDTGDKVDAFSDGCLIRYEGGPRTTCGSDYTCADPNDPVLYCGSLLNTAVAGQDSIFDLNALTTNANKRVIWSHNAGSLSNRPMLNTNATFGQRVYAANQGGTMFAYGPSGNGLGGPDIKWSYAVAPGSTINRSPWIEPRGGTFKDKILVLDTAGILRAYQDNGSSTGPALWSQASSGTATWQSLAIVLPGNSNSYAFVGRNDGYLQQVDLASGNQQGRQQVNSANNAFVGDLVFDPSLDLQDHVNLNLNRAYVVDDGGGVNHAIKRFKLPFCTDSGGSGASGTCSTNADGTNSCTSWAGTPGSVGGGYNPCVAIACDNLVSSQCEYSHGVPGGNSDVVGGGVEMAPDGTACDDGIACTQAPAPPSPISCSTNDDCPHADVFLQQCGCTGGTANPCALFGHDTVHVPCTTDDALTCVDPNFPRCDTNGTVQACEALCPGQTTASLAQTLPTATIAVTANGTLGRFPPAGTIIVQTTTGAQTVTYTGITASSFTGCSGGTGSTTLPGQVLATVSPAAVNTTLTAGGTLPLGTINVGSTTGYPASGFLNVTSSLGPQTVAYTAKTATSFTGCTGGAGTLGIGSAVAQLYNICANCPTKIVRTYYMKCVANRCVCNQGAGVNCNDVCLAGKCTGTNTTSCQCLQPGDRACSTGSTCCGFNHGGCVDVSSNPQHCGACGSDCGSYSVPANTTVDSSSNGNTLPAGGTVNVASTSAFAQSGTLQISTNLGVQSVSYTATTPTSFTGVSGGSGVLGTGGTVLPSTATACTSNADCGSCTNDGACHSAGINSRCVDPVGGTGHCGSCTVDCACFFNADCTSKGYNGATCTGAAYPNTLGTCTGGTPACAGYCKRLTSTGHCSNGICDVCSGSGSCSCDFPSVSELQTAAPVGLSGLTFERVTGANPQVCGAYVSTYNDNLSTQNTACSGGCAAGTTCVGATCQAISLERIVKGGTKTLYTSADFHPLNGVAVPQSGWDVLGNFIANTGNPSGGMAERPNGLTTFSDVTTATALPATGANNPFSQAKLNDGTVGPALDYVTFTDSIATTHSAYFGNWSKAGDLVKVSNNGSVWAFTNYASYVPSQVSCGGGCGAAVTCDSPFTGHPKTCGASTDCSAGGVASGCVAGHCRCGPPETCDATGACACPAPATCSGGVCACPGPGELCSGNVCTCSSDGNCLAGQSCVNGRCAQRVTAVALGEVQDTHRVTQRKLVVGHGAILSIIDLSTGAQTDVNLATSFVPLPATNQATVNGILGIAIHPQCGDIWVEVKGTNNFRYLINVDSGDNSCRHGLTCQRSYQHTQNPTNPIPLDFGNTSDGHIVFMPDGMLLRYGAVVNGAPTNLTSYNVSKQ